MLKRRGYTFFSLDEKVKDLDEEVGLKLLEHIQQMMPRVAQLGARSFADLLGVVAADQDATHLLQEIASSLSDLAENRERREELGCTASDIKRFIQAVGAYNEALQKDQRNRRNYLAYLKAELGRRAPLPGIPLDATQLYHLIGNIANMQQRDLRHYFDGIMPGTPLDTGKLHRALARSVNLRHIAKLAPGDGLACLLQADPLTTCPGYEDDHVRVPRFENQNNRRPPRCPALRLNPAHPAIAALPPGKLAAFADACRAQWFSRAITHTIAPLDILQALFDGNAQSLCGLREYFENHPDASAATASSDLRANSHFLTLQHICDTTGVNLLALLDAAKAYTAAVTLAANTGAVPDNAAIRVCAAHPPQKAKLANQLVAILLMRDTVDAAALVRCIKKRRLSTAFTRVADAVKRYRSGIKLLLDQPTAETNMEIEVLNRDINHLAECLDAFVADGDPEPVRLHRDPFVLSQLFHILFDPRGGFATNCAACAAVNHLRKLNGVRQLPRSEREFHKPFDGMVGRIIDRLAWEIAARKATQLSSVVAAQPDVGVEIPIALEANSFRFSLEMANRRQNRKKILKRLEAQRAGADIAFLAKRERIKADARGICAYCGGPLGDDGEIDHIVPRAFELQNAEFNLIYVHRECNRKKLKSVYTIKNIAPAFLAAYGLSDPSVLRNRIQELIALLERKNAAAGDVAKSDTERTLCRLGLLHPDFSAAYRSLLAGRRVATVNGTQRYLKARLIEKLNVLLDKAGHTGPRSFLSYETPAQDISAMRDTLRAQHPDLPTKDGDGGQSAYSHILDATLAAFIRDPHYAGDVYADLPQRIEIAPITSWPKHKRLEHSPAATPHFKDTLYAERFVPILLTRTGQFLLGFASNNAIELPGDTLVRTLFPLLQMPADCATYDAYLAHQQSLLRASSKRVFPLVIDRQKYSQAALRRAQSHDDDAMREALEAADAIRYYTVKKPVIDEKGALYRPSQQELDISITLARHHIGSRKALPVTLAFPAAREWERLRKHCEAGREIPAFFLSPGRSAPSYHAGHERVRQHFSLPVVVAPSGGVRLHRAAATQVVAVESGLTAGLDAHSLEPVLAPHYARSRRVVPTSHMPAPAQVIPIGYIAELSIPDSYPHVLRAAAEVGADSTRQVFLLELTPAAMRDILGYDPLFSLVPQLAKNALNAEAWRRIVPSKFSVPRDWKCSVTRVTPDAVHITYTGARTKGILREIAAAWLAAQAPQNRPA